MVQPELAGRPDTPSAVQGATTVIGASGAIGSRLTDRLLGRGEAPVVAGRRQERLRSRWPGLKTVAVDVLRPETIGAALRGASVAYYLVHSMGPRDGADFRERDAIGAANFAREAGEAGVERIVYLGGLGGDGGRLSDHLRSRHETGRILAKHGPPVLEFRAAMVVGDGSASYRMLTDLVRRLPAMVLPRWVSTLSQPIAVDDVVSYLAAAPRVPMRDHHTVVEIGGPDVLTYRQMIEIVAREHARRPLLVTVPFLTPGLSSYWCTITTSVPLALAKPLIAGMTTPTVMRSGVARALFADIRPMSFVEAIRRTSV